VHVHITLITLSVFQILKRVILLSVVYDHKSYYDLFLGLNCRKKLAQADIDAVAKPDPKQLALSFPLNKKSATVDMIFSAC